MTDLMAHDWAALNSPEVEITPPPAVPTRSLGGAIILAAIDDYRHCDAVGHLSASRFLYPADAEHRDHLIWAVGTAPGVAMIWLRAKLDEYRPFWDRERAARDWSKRRYQTPFAKPQ